MLLVGYPPAYSGAGAQGAKLASELARQGVAVTVLCPAPGASEAPAVEEQGKLVVRRFRVPSADSRHLVFGLRCALWLLAHGGWQLLHLHGFSYWSVSPVWVARLKRRPVLVKTTLLGPGADGALRGELSLPQRVIAASYRRVQAIVALSDALAASFVETPGYRARIERIPNGVDTEDFRPAEGDEKGAARKRFDLPQDAAVAVSVGRLEARKNIVALVEAAAEVKHRPLCLALVGPPSPYPEDVIALDRAVAALPPGVEVRFVGELPPSELPEMLRGADILVLPSRAEGMPNSLLEGMASGLGCVASDIPGSRDVLARGGGVLVPLDDREAMARQLDAWLSDPVELARMGAEGRRLAEEHYSIQSVARRYVDLYRTLLERE